MPCACQNENRPCNIVEADVRMWAIRMSCPDLQMLTDAGISRDGISRDVEARPVQDRAPNREK